MQKSYICKEKFENKYVKDVAYSICNLKYSIPEKIPIVFHNGPNYDYNFIIKELAKESEMQFTCLGENTDKCMNLYSSNRKRSYKN